MDNKLITLVMTLTIAIVIGGSLMAPTINSAITGEEHTYSNEKSGLTYINLAEFATTDEVTLTFEYDDGNYVVNDTTFAFTSQNFVQYALLTDICLLQTVNNSSTMFFATQNGDSSSSALIDASGDSISLTASNGTISVTTVVDGTTTTYSETYTWIYAADEDGEYITGNSSITAYFDTGSPVAVARSDGIIWTLKDGVATGGGVEGTVNTEFTEVLNDIESNLGKISVTVGETTYEFGTWVVPAEITTYTTDFNAGQAAILAAIPVIFFAGLLVAAVGTIIKGRN